MDKSMERVARALAQALVGPVEPDWLYWRSMGHLKLFSAAALIVGMDPAFIEITRARRDKTVGDGRPLDEQTEQAWQHFNSRNGYKILVVLLSHFEDQPSAFNRRVPTPRIIELVESNAFLLNEASTGFLENFLGVEEEGREINDAESEFIEDLRAGHRKRIAALLNTLREVGTFDWLLSFACAKRYRTVAEGDSKPKRFSRKSVVKDVIQNAPWIHGLRQELGIDDQKITESKVRYIAQLISCINNTPPEYWETKEADPISPEEEERLLVGNLER